MQEAHHGDPKLHFIPLWMTPYNKIKGNINMKQITILSLLMLTINLLMSATLEVAIDGTKPYTSIQTAIDASSNGDVIQVYPGTYRENISFMEKSLTLQSLYAVETDTNYIHQTRIIGDVSQSAIVIELSNVIIDGFTISNNENHQEIFKNIAGGGIYLDKSISIIKNNIIKDCLVGHGGGGLCLKSTYTYTSNVVLENNQIFNNKAYTNGGGLVIDGNINVEFSQIHKNSIYNNSSFAGKDISLASPQHPVNIVLDQCSQDMAEIDHYYISLYFPVEVIEVNITVDIQRGTLPTINHDLYVAPWGNDQNDGLSPSSPLKSIDYATKIIASDAENPKTVYLAEGTYSRSMNQQNFPVSIKPNSFFKGAGMYESILDDEHVSHSLGASSLYGKLVISDFSIINNGNFIDNTQGFNVVADEIVVKNIFFNSNSISGYNGLNAHLANDVFVKNIIIENTLSEGRASSCLFANNSNVFIENIIDDHSISTANTGDHIGMTFWANNNILLNNVSISNGRSPEPMLFQVSCAEQAEDFVPGEIFLNNVLIFNNQTTPGFFDTALVEIWDSYSPVVMNNWTIANNFGNNKALHLGGIPPVLNNCILYNPELTYEVVLGSQYTPISNGTINNSLIYGGMSKILVYGEESNLQLNNVIFSNPMFLGENSDSLSVDMMDYYRLSPNSPCIDSGIADTTGTFIPYYDLAGNQRVWNDRIDMGALEYGAPPVNNDDPVVIPNPEYQLSNYPNPINLNKHSATMISFNYPEKAIKDPEIIIFNVKGQKVRTLNTGMSFKDLAISAGLSKDVLNQISTRNYSATWDIRDEHKNRVPSGVYFYCAKVNGKIIQTKKMLVLK